MTSLKLSGLLFISHSRNGHFITAFFLLSLLLLLLDDDDENAGHLRRASLNIDWAVCFW